MAEHYTGAEVYDKLVNSIGFMEKRVKALDTQVRDIDGDIGGVVLQIDTARVDLARAYLKEGRLEKEEERKRLQELTGLDISYVYHEYAKREAQLQDDQQEIEKNRIYLMRDSVRLKGEENTTLFADERLNVLVELEEHEGYKHLRAKGYLKGEHKAGLFGFAGRRLNKIADATAQELGYDSYEHMELGNSGRREQRWSIPILLTNEDLSVREVKERVDDLVNQHGDITLKLGRSAHERLEYAITELAQHFSVISLSNLENGGIAEVVTYIDILTDLKGQKDSFIQKTESIRSEQSSLTQKIGELNELLAGHPNLQKSKQTISARKIDDMFSSNSPSPDYKSLAELDAMIKREFPDAISYQYQYTERSADQVSRAEYERIKREAGGVDKWTEWRDV